LCAAASSTSTGETWVQSYDFEKIFVESIGEKNWLKLRGFYAEKNYRNIVSQKNAVVALAAWSKNIVYTCHRGVWS
jgi:hypothetical protein